MKKLFTTLLCALCFAGMLHAQTNISLNKNSSASTGNSSSGAFDGNLNTAWNAVNYAPAWISVDLGATSNVSHIVFNVAQNPNGNTVHEIYSSADGLNWQLVETINSFTTDLMEFTRFYTNLNGVRYIKIQTISSPYWVAWFEISVFGTQNPDNVVTTTPQITLSATSVPAGGTMLINGKFFTPNSTARLNFFGAGGSSNTTVNVNAQGRFAYTYTAATNPTVAQNGLSGVRCTDGVTNMQSAVKTFYITPAVAAPPRSFLTLSNPTAGQSYQATRTINVTWATVCSAVMAVIIT